MATVGEASKFTKRSRRVRAFVAEPIAFPSILERLLSGSSLEAETVEHVFGAIFDGDLTSAQIAAFAIALRNKGETPEEIAAAARALRARASMIRPDLAKGVPLLDTCGTGGDGASTFNVSTVAAIVVASCGVVVGKHGNRAVSSKSGSADLVEALGIPLDSPAPDFDARVKRSIEEVGIGFLFAPRHHGALRHAAATRRELGVRTIFNLLGPIANPAGATHQLLGIYDGSRREMVAEVLRLLGTKRAWVVHAVPSDESPRGLDEVSPSGMTKVSELRPDGTIRELSVVPEDAGLVRVPLSALRGGDAKDNVAIAHAVLAGEKSPARTAVVLNAACALVVAEKTTDLKEGRARAEAAIDSGNAARTLKRWKSMMLDENEARS